MIKILQISLAEDAEKRLAEYSEIPSAFRFTKILDVLPLNQGLKGVALKERTVTEQEKDYDEVEPPLRWAQTWDLSKWVIFRAVQDRIYVGGCLVGRDTTGVDMLEGRSDIAVLWDIRVLPSHRSRGVGSALFRQALAWAHEHGCRYLRVDTQNTNAAACRFYQRNGCELETIKRFHYEAFPDEVQLIWRIDTTTGGEQAGGVNRYSAALHTHASPRHWEKK